MLYVIPRSSHAFQQVSLGELLGRCQKNCSAIDAAVERLLLNHPANRFVVGLLATFGGYWLLARFSVYLSIQYFPVPLASEAMPLWLPAGFAIAMYLRFPWSSLIGTFLAESLSGTESLFPHDSVVVALLFSTLNVGKVYLTCLVVRRAIHRNHVIDGLYKKPPAICVVVVIGLPLFNAIATSVTTTQVGACHPDTFLTNTVQWFIGDLAGMAVWSPWIMLSLVRIQVNSRRAALEKISVDDLYKQFVADFTPQYDCSPEELERAFRMTYARIHAELPEQVSKPITIDYVYEYLRRCAEIYLMRRGIQCSFGGRWFDER